VTTRARETAVATSAELEEVEPNLSSPPPRQPALRIDELATGARLVIRTETVVYQMTIIDPRTRQAVVSGGPLFPLPMGVQVDGCSCQGMFLEIGSICIGCSLELRTPHGLVVTAPVRSIGYVQHR
jgi:hypothetical protein